MEYYFVTTDSLQERAWFRDEDDFKVGMNTVAVVADSSQTHVLAFVLMSNHVHFVLACEGEPEAVSFINHLKRNYAAYLRMRYGDREFLRRNGVDIRIVSPEDESLERAIAYTLMNPVVAGLCAHPMGYRWGSGACYFTDGTVSGTRLSEMSVRAVIRLLHSNRKMRRDLLVSDDGMVLPHGYVAWKYVEKQFRTPKRYNYLLRNTASARQKLEYGLKHISLYQDPVIRKAIPDICRSRFGVESPKELDAGQQVDLIYELHRAFNADAKQVARVLGVRLEAAEAVLA